MLGMGVSYHSTTAKQENAKLGPNMSGEHFCSLADNSFPLIYHNERQTTVLQYHGTIYC